MAPEEVMAQGAAIEARELSLVPKKYEKLT